MGVVPRRWRAGEGCESCSLGYHRVNLPRSLACTQCDASAELLGAAIAIGMLVALATVVLFALAFRDDVPDWAIRSQPLRERVLPPEMPLRALLSETLVLTLSCRAMVACLSTPATSLCRSEA